VIESGNAADISRDTPLSGDVRDHFR
jgi:hypothetical protein